MIHTVFKMACCILICSLIAFIIASVRLVNKNENQVHSRHFNDFIYFTNDTVVTRADGKCTCTGPLCGDNLIKKGCDNLNRMWGKDG